MSEENGKAPEQPQPQPQGTQLNMMLTPQGAVLTFPVNVGLDNETMKQLIRVYLQSHPELLQELAQTALKAKQQELAIIKHVQRSKRN